MKDIIVEIVFYIIICIITFWNILPIFTYIRNKRRYKKRAKLLADRHEKRKKEFDDLYYEVVRNILIDKGVNVSDNDVRKVFANVIPNYGLLSRITGENTWRQDLSKISEANVFRMEFQLRPEKTDIIEEEFKQTFKKELRYINRKGRIDSLLKNLNN